MNSKQTELELVRELRNREGRRVWEAIQQPLGRRIAYIQLSEGVLPSSPRARALVDEVRAHALLNHLNISQVYSFSITATDVLVEAELAEGTPVIPYLKAHPDQTLSILSQIATALAYAHGRGVLHGGLHAESIQVLEGGVVKISGFRVIVPDSRSVATLDVTSETALLCPEVREGGVFSTLSDVYLFGALVYQITTTEEVRPDDHARSLRAMLSRGLSGRLVKKGLPELVDRCLAPIPADRPETMTEVVMELERIRALDELAEREGASHLRSRARFFWLLAPLLVLCVVLAALLVVRTRPREPAPLTRVPLESSESQMARVRVVARPWARVFVDGAFKDTTPFAALLSVSPGQHWVRLEHPSAPPEERLIEVQAGQIAIVDVEMRVQVSPLPKGQMLPLVETTP